MGIEEFSIFNDIYDRTSHLSGREVSAVQEFIPNLLGGFNPSDSGRWNRTAEDDLEQSSEISSAEVMHIYSSCGDGSVGPVFLDYTTVEAPAMCPLDLSK